MKMFMPCMRCITVLESMSVVQSYAYYCNLARDCLLGLIAHYRMQMVLVNQSNYSSVSCLNFLVMFLNNLLKIQLSPETNKCYDTVASSLDKT